jgi:hypothetical protein
MLQLGESSNAVISSNVQGIVEQAVTDLSNQSKSSIDFVKGPRITKTTFPHLIHDFFGLRFVFAERSCAHGEYCSSSNAFLVLLCEFPLSSSKEFSSPSTLAAEGTCADLNRPSTIRPCNRRRVREENTSVQAACLKSLSQFNLNRRWSYACTISCAIVSSK